MTFRHGDIFDKYSSVDYVSRYWHSGGIEITLNSQITPYNSGLSLNMYQSYIYYNWGHNDTTIFLSFNIFNGIRLILLDNRTAQYSIDIHLDGSIVIYSGTTGSTVIGSMPVGTLDITRFWYSIQAKIVIDSVNGSIELRKSGLSTPFLTLNNVNTRGGTSNNYVNEYEFDGIDGNHAYLNNPAVWSGDSTAPNNWVGELRGHSLLPSNSVQSQFAITGAANNVAAVQTADGDTSYISTTTAGNKDIVSFTSLPSITGSYNIIGVQPWVVWRRSDIGLLSAGLSISANGSADTSVLISNEILSNPYSFAYAFEAKDPTNAVWNQTSVNSINLGVTKIA